MDFIYPSPIGPLTLSSDGERLTGLKFGQDAPGADLADSPVSCCANKDGIESGTAPFASTIEWLDRYFSGVDPGPIPPVSIEGRSEFSRLVLETLMTIPYGQTMTYGQIARIVSEKRGRPQMSVQDAGGVCSKMAARAVGGAVHANPIGIIIPCHRVLGANGKLTGFAGGLDRKAFLLNLEKH